MKDYTGLYNERFTKQAPRYTNAYQARTYQDYIRNIQNQRAAAGQTFGGLNAQIQNQSFYDRAMGTPPGLSGGMEQQFSNQLSGARARQLGQTAQQRFQAFSDISNQEMQASQFARAEAAAEQQFQSQNIAFKQQQQQQAQAIMASNASDSIKEFQLREIGLTEDEIASMGPVAGPAIVGGVTTAAVGVPTAIKGVNALTLRANRTIIQELAGTNAKELFVDGVVQTGDKINVPTSDRLKGLYDETVELVNKGAAEGADDAAKQAGQEAIEKYAEAQKKYVEDVVSGTTREKGSNVAIDTIDDVVRESVDEATEAGVKVISKKKKVLLATKKKSIAKIMGKKLGGAKVVKALSGFIASPAGIAIAAFLVAEVGSQILTGTGILKGTINLLSNKAYNEGTKGLLNL